MYGKIKSGWEANDETLKMNVSIPANTAARVCVPAESASNIKENGAALNASKDLKVMGSANGYVELELGSGEYQFEVTK